MASPSFKSNPIVAALLAAVWFSLLAPVSAYAETESPELDQLFERLKQPVLPEWQTIEGDILIRWSRSGSAAADLLLTRGRQALDAGDLPAAIEHFTAVIDHAPDFAEGYNMRATAYYLGGEFGPSIADIEATLALNPRHFGALSGFGMILEELGMPEKALEAYRAAQALHPHQEGVNQSIDRILREIEGTGI
jgi:tetratricopeptide (TPR) repeat protein